MFSSGFCLYLSICFYVALLCASVSSSGKCYLSAWHNLPQTLMFDFQFWPQMLLLRELFSESQYKLASSTQSNSHSLSHNLLLFSTALTTTWSHLFHLSLHSFTACLLPEECQVHESKNSVHLAHNYIPISNHSIHSWEIRNSWMDVEWERERRVRKVISKNGHIDECNTIENL